MRYNVTVAYVLWLFSGFGALGFHRFYLGKVPTGVLWFLTGGLGMVGSIYDFVTLRNQVERANLEDAIRRGLVSYSGAESPMRPVQEHEPIERTILKVASKNHGQVTPGEVALEGDCTIEEARRELEKLAARGAAEMRVRASGVVVYVFSEFGEGDRNFVV
ncbi:MAG: TM2 domain-containing protein [Rectinemataceae bacterium]